MFSDRSPDLVTTIPASGVAQWFNGCYKNDEDDCFGGLDTNKDKADTREGKAKALPQSLPKLQVISPYHYLEDNKSKNE